MDISETPEQMNPLFCPCFEDQLGEVFAPLPPVNLPFGAGIYGCGASRLTAANLSSSAGSMPNVRQ